MVVLDLGKGPHTGVVLPYGRSVSPVVAVRYTCVCHSGRCGMHLPDDLRPIAVLADRLKRLTGSP